MWKRAYMTPARIDAQGNTVGGDVVERLADNESAENLFMEPARMVADGTLVRGEVFGVKKEASAQNSAAARELMPSTPYYAGHEYKEGRWVANDAAAPAAPATPPVTPGKLSQAEQDALESERAMLVRQLPDLMGGDYSKAQRRLSWIEDALRKARRWDHVERENAHRQDERLREEKQGGPASGAHNLEQSMQGLKAAMDTLHRVIPPKKSSAQKKNDTTKQTTNSIQQVVNWDGMSMADKTTLIQETLKEMRRVGAVK